MLGGIIKNLRQAQALTQQELAQQLNVSQQAVAKWERGQAHPTPELLPRLAELFSVSTDYLLGYESARQGGVWLPVVGVVRAGYGMLAYEDDYGRELAGVDDPGRYFYLMVRGHSMEPSIRDGDLALVRKQPTLEHGDLGVLLVGGEEGTLKRFRRERNRVLLEPFNPAYETLVLEGPELEQLQVAGRVMETRSRW